MSGCALVCGTSGFIGGHLVKRLKHDGFSVCGVDLKFHEFSETESDDLRRHDNSPGPRKLHVETERSNGQSSSKHALRHSPTYSEGLRNARFARRVGVV